MQTKQRSVPSPDPNPETMAFWEGTKQGKLLIRKCPACTKFNYYPRAVCPYCFCPETTWHEASGRGEIYSYSVMRGAPVPYAIAYVRLEEGVTMMTNIVDCDFGSLGIGLPVEVSFRPSESGQYMMPMFKLSAKASTNA